MLDIYGLDETAGTWRRKAAALAADVVARHATDVDINARFPSESMAALAQRDFHGLCIDARFGGQGQGPATFAAVVEELARHCGSTAMVYVMHIAATKVIETSVTLPTGPTGTFNGLGLRGNDSAPVQLEGVVVRQEDLLTEHGKGLECALQVATPWFNVGSTANGQWTLPGGRERDSESSARDGF